jgi:hypothetical protein
MRGWIPATIGGMNMNGIPIGDKYIIETADPLNVIVKVKIEKKPPKEGAKKPKKDSKPEDEWRSIGYHPNLEKAFTTIVDREINLAVDDGLKKVIKTIADLKKFKKTILEG